MPHSSSVDNAQALASPMLSFPMPAGVLLPQSGPMMVLDMATYADEDRAEAITTIKEDHLMRNPDGSFPAMGLIEMLAQTIGIYAGWLRKQANEAPRIGLLLGTRNFTLNCTTLKSGTVVKTVAVKTFESEEGLWQFDTAAYAVVDDVVSTEPLATAVITVFNADPKFFESLVKA